MNYFDIQAEPGTILNLKSLPRKNMEQEYRLAELEAEYKRLMRCEK
mgnify:CR=1 FL=1